MGCSLTDINIKPSHEWMNAPLTGLSEVSRSNFQSGEIWQLFEGGGDPIDRFPPKLSRDIQVLSPTLLFDRVGKPKDSQAIHNSDICVKL